MTTSKNTIRATKYLPEMVASAQIFLGKPLPGHDSALILVVFRLSAAWIVVRPVLDERSFGLRSSAAKVAGQKA